MSRKTIRFVADSTCDIPADLIEKYQIGIAPCYINYGGESHPDTGDPAFREQYYQQLPNLRPHPTTAAMSPAVAEEIIHRTLEGADHVVILSVSSKLSGVYNALRLGASGLREDQYTLIDSLNTTMGLGFQVLIGAEVAAETGDVAQVVDAIHRVRSVAHVFVALETLEYLRRGGRVSWARASIGNLLQIKPILDVHDGEAKSAGRARTFRRAVEEVKRLVREQAPLDRMAVVYATDEDEAHKLREELSDIAPPEVLTVRITPTLGTHIGPGGVGVATISKKWRTQS
jgi:DegV family protein with EDD domain